MSVINMDLPALIERMANMLNNMTREEKNPSHPYLGEPFKQDLLQLAHMVNKYPNELAATSCQNRKKLRDIIAYLPTSLFYATQLRNITGVQQATEQLFRLLTEPQSVHFWAENLKPSQFYGKAQRPFRKRTPIEDTVPDNYQTTMKRISAFLKQGDYDTDSLPLPEKMILNALLGRVQVHEIPLTADRVRFYLTHIKIIDLAIRQYQRQEKSKVPVVLHASYDLRSKILEVGSPDITTKEVYTWTLDPRKMKDRLFLSDPNNWIPERTARHLKSIANQTILAAALSRRLNYGKPAMWAIRANTAAGKSKFIRENGRFQQAANEFGCVTGVLNPDLIKDELKRKEPTDRQNTLLNHQVHEEGAALFKAFSEGLNTHAIHASLLIEGRLSTIEELENQVLRPAEKWNGEVVLLDIETPLITSIYRVLMRDPLTDQCPSLLDVIKGYKESILYRKKLLEIIQKSPLFPYYALYFQDHRGNRYLVAEKQYNRFTIWSQRLLNATCEALSDREIQAQMQQVISTESIEQAIKQREVPEDCRGQLERWKGFTMAEAVDLHAKRLSTAQAVERMREMRQWKERYGEVTLYPFTGSWLSDYPEIIEHIESEHLLHIRGVDEEGRGLHWQTGKFSWKLNPQFNPEAKVDGAFKGGFEMPIGYYIVPPSKIEAVSSITLSPHLLKELEVTDSAGGLIGYRFFVHPEAYEHFKALHAAGIPFIKPEASEFIGTPTSSYRSWVIRRVISAQRNRIASPKSVPFIIKLGVSVTGTDTNRLLPKAVIHKSIQTQNMFDECFKARGSQGSEFFLFPETYGMSLKDIPNYPATLDPQSGELIDSGLMIREFPEALLTGDCRLFSFSALMSVERIKVEHQGLCAQNANDTNLASLPLIYAVIAASIKQGIVNTPEEFVHQVLIHGYLKATEQLFFKMGRPFAPHGQNLCLVLNSDYTVRGFAYRDYEGVAHEKELGYLETFSWFYRYHIFIKLLNVITRSGQESVEPPIGAPLQIGCGHKLPERNLNHYLFKQLKGESQKVLEQLSLTPEQSNKAIKQLDEAFIARLQAYFNVKAAKILTNEGCLPAVEAEFGKAPHNIRLWRECYDLTLLTQEVVGQSPTTHGCCVFG